MSNDPIDGALTLLTSPTGVFALIVCGVCLAAARIYKTAKKPRTAGVVVAILLIGLLVGVVRNMDVLQMAFQWPELSADPETAGFHATFEEARKRPLYNVDVPDNTYDKFTITGCEIRGSYLIETTYDCRRIGSDRSWFATRTIRVLDKNMQPIGRVWRSQLSRGEFADSFHGYFDEQGHLRRQDLLDELANGSTVIDGHDSAINVHMQSLQKSLHEQQERAAAYAKKARDGG